MDWNFHFNVTVNVKPPPDISIIEDDSSDDGSVDDDNDDGSDNDADEDGSDDDCSNDEDDDDRDKDKWKLTHKYMITITYISLMKK